jgi:curved DNA-binding protein CbpA
VAFGADPFRILGLPPGSSQAEIKRAYRRLAKAFHPDTAGQAAIPRFLAIQSAYDELTRDARKAGMGPPGRRGPTGGSGGAAGPGGATGRAAGGSSGSGGARRPGWWADPDRGRAGRARTGSGGGGAGTGRATPGERTSGGSATGGKPRRGSRQPGRATPGSTTYDEADVDPFDPEWSGGSWYGAASGTYWTINPREYADPRKHGPEYQARARRRAEAVESESADETRTSDAAGPIGSGGSSTGASEAPRPDTPRRPAPAPAASAGHAAEAPPRPNDRRIPPPPAEEVLPPDPLAALPLPGGPGRRIAVALLGWPPLGVAIAWVLGELSGCGRFSAGCVETFAAGTWLAQFAVLGGLLLLPALAAASAVGTLAMLAAALPATIFLSAFGGARQPDAAGGALAVVLAVAWFAGAAFAVGRRSRTIPP